MEEKKVKILVNSYTTDYPTVGQLIDMKRMEMTLSGNKMYELVSSGMVEDAEIALDIKCLSTMSILFPKLLEDLKTENLRDLRYDDWQEVYGVFIKEIFPWMTEWKRGVKENSADRKISKLVKDGSNTDTGAEG